MRLDGLGDLPFGSQETGPVGLEDRDFCELGSEFGCESGRELGSEFGRRGLTPNGFDLLLISF